MPLARFAYVPQPVFPNQRSNERIFVVTHRSFVDFIFFGTLVSILFFLPLILIAIFWSDFTLLMTSLDVIGRDLLIIGALAYYLVLSLVFLTSWVIYYYNIFVVTDERIVEIAQKGLFNREIHELVFEQIEDVSSRTHGLLSTIFEAGDLEIQSAGSTRNFLIKTLPQPELIVEIILELAQQTKKNVELSKRMPDLAVIALINGQPISKTAVKPPIMNFERNLSNVSTNYTANFSKPKSIREKIDYWWWTQSNQMLATFTRDYAKRGKKETGKKERDSDEMLDL